MYSCRFRCLFLVLLTNTLCGGSPATSTSSIESRLAEGDLWGSLTEAFHSDDPTIILTTCITVLRKQSQATSVRRASTRYSLYRKDDRLSAAARAGVNVAELCVNAWTATCRSPLIKIDEMEESENQKLLGDLAMVVVSMLAPPNDDIDLLKEWREIALKAYDRVLKLHEFIPMRLVDKDLTDALSNTVDLLLVLGRPDEAAYNIHWYKCVVDSYASEGETFDNPEIGKRIAGVDDLLRELEARCELYPIPGL